MKNIELYKKTCDILYDAYFDGTLVHGNQCVCAVGNLIARNMGIEITTKMINGSERFVWQYANPYWDNVHVVTSIGQVIHPQRYCDIAKVQIDSTGYTWEETAMIEEAFETADKGNSADDWIYNGLVAVLKILAEIHEMTEDTQTERFTEHHNKKVLA